MTILPKKKPTESESGSDNDSNNSSSSHTAAGHVVDPLPDDGTYHSPEGYFHRRYDLSCSSGESSPELSPLNKRAGYRPSSTNAAATRAKKPPLDASPGYNSSEEYDGPHGRYTYLDPERECQFEQALKSTTGMVIKKMRPDGACLFRAVADQVYGDQEMQSVVRNHCMDYMMKNADYFSQFITEEDFEHYVNRKRSDKCYGNNIEMQAMAEMYNRAIEVYQYSTEPINIFFGVYKTDNAPIRLSYHGRIHYNSVVDPCQATIGVGLGLAGFTPGLADKNLLKDATKESETVHIEQAMLEDKMRSTDWETTYDALEEAVARESYLSWLRENEQRGLNGTQSTSASSRGTSSRHPTLPPPITATSSASQSTPGTPPHSSTDVSSPNATKSVTVKRGSSHKNLQSDKTTKLGKSHSAVFHSSDYRAPRRAIPSPPGSFSYRSSSGNGSVRGSPYHSPRDSPRNGSLRGSARNSPKGGSPRTSAHNSPRSSVSNSPSPPPSLITAVSYTSGGSAPSSPQELVPRRSKPNSPKQESPRSGPTTPLTRRSPVDTNEGHPTSAGSQTPPLNLDFESGQVVSQLPFEYSSFLDLPPSALGLSEWEDDRVLAAVLAASQQEYIDSLKRTSRGAEGL
ncbi:OTU domain-containing protein 5-B-like isoform X2 [Halichondria panicea]|uniref:OTU domain-containing protein 5-B-like isoform X2 n=1 Tax=Halichondria panicea TaxID=6063 RepID=UPI00312B3D23